MKYGNTQFTYTNLAPLSTDIKLCGSYYSTFIWAILTSVISVHFPPSPLISIIFLLISVTLDRTEIKDDSHTALTLPTVFTGRSLPPCPVPADSGTLIY